MNLSLTLQQIFPVTFSLMTDLQSRSLQSQFENEWGFENLHFFPMLVRDRKFSKEITEVADFEYLKYWLQDQPGAFALSGAHLYLNSNVQVVLLSAGAQALKREPGVYALWKVGNEIRDRKLSKEEALFLDRLRDDQLVYRKDLNEAELDLLSQLRNERIVFENADLVSALSAKDSI